MSAVVTGAGSGLGRSIAIGIARAAANVAIFDINKEEARQTCEIIKEEMPDISAVDVLCDVTNEADVKKAFAIINNHRLKPVALPYSGVARLPWRLFLSTS